MDCPGNCLHVKRLVRASMRDSTSFFFSSSSRVTDLIDSNSQTQSLASAFSWYPSRDFKRAFMASLHCPQATAWIAASPPANISSRLTYCLIFSLYIVSCVLVGLGPSSAGITSTGGWMVSLKSGTKSSGCAILLFTYVCNASIVVRN